MTYQVHIPAKVQDALGRLQEGDPVGAELIVGTIAALAADPRPAGAHMLTHALGLHRIHSARLDPATGRTLQYRIMYQIDDEDLVVTIITAGALPRASRRR